MENGRKSYIKNTIYNYLYKFLSMGLSYVTVPITLSYLDTERYGVWQTILTIISWASLSNFGIGNGLRNKVTEMITEKKHEKLKSYITNAYIYLSSIAMIILVVSITGLTKLNISILFMNSTIKNSEITISFIIIIISFCINFILGISSSISFGIHKSSTVNFFTVITNLITLIGIYIVKIGANISLINISVVYLIANTASNLIFTIYLFTDEKLRPSIKYRDRNSGKELTSLGLEFFILQLASIILFSTDNFIISTFIGVDKVTNYSIVSKLFQVVSTLFSILLIQVWSSVAESKCKGQYTQIKKMVKSLILLLIPVGIVLITMVLFFESISKVWLGKSIYVDKSLVSLAAFYAFIICFNGIFVNVQNGMSKVRIQTIASIVSCIINIPVAIIFIKIFNLELIGVMLSNILCLLVTSIMCSLDVMFRINKEL